MSRSRDEDQLPLMPPLTAIMLRSDKMHLSGPRCSSAVRGAPRVAGAGCVVGIRVNKERRPVGSAPNTFLLRALSRVVHPDVPLVTAEQAQQPTHRIPTSLLD